jgi:predicted permease
LFIRALEAVATMLILIGIGYFFAWRGWLGANGARRSPSISGAAGHEAQLQGEGNRLLSAIVIRVAMPGVILSNIMTAYTRENLAAQLSLIAAPALSIAAGIPIALLLARLLHVPENRRGVFATMTAFSNSVFIGFPVTRAVLGESAIPYATLYYLANTTLFWTIGAPLIRRDADKRPVSAAAALKRLINAPLATLFASFILVLLGVRLPDFVLSAAETIGDTVTPLSMMFIGSMLYGVTRAGIRWEKGFGALLGMRFLAAPLIMLAVCAPLGVTGLTLQAYFLQAGMSAMTQVAIISHGFGADSEYASLGVALTTVALMLALPVYALFMSSAL